MYSLIPADDITEFRHCWTRPALRKRLKWLESVALVTTTDGEGDFDTQTELDQHTALCREILGA